MSELFFVWSLRCELLAPVSVSSVCGFAKTKTKTVLPFFFCFFSWFSAFNNNDFFCFFLVFVPTGSFAAASWICLLTRPTVRPCGQPSTSLASTRAYAHHCRAWSVLLRKKMPEAFVPAPKYAGRREGYYFRLGDHGVGYYRDEGPFGGPTASQPQKRSSSSSSSSSSSLSSASSNGAVAKRSRQDLPSEPQAGKKKGESIDEILARGDAAEVEELSPVVVKRMLVQFEKRINNNQLMRAKYADKPAKFVESEVDLDESLQRLHNLASSPQYYPLITKNESHISIIALLSHDNTDISLDVIALLYELTDPAVLAELGAEKSGAFVDALVQNSMFELLVQNLQRLDEVISF